MLLSDITKKFFENLIIANYQSSDICYFHIRVFNHVYRSLGRNHKVFRELNHEDPSMISQKFRDLIHECFDDIENYFYYVKSMHNEKDNYNDLETPMFYFKVYYIISKYTGNTSWTNFMCNNCVNCKYCLFCRNCRNCNECSNCNVCIDCNNCFGNKQCCECKFCIYCSDSNDCDSCDYCNECNSCQNCSYITRVSYCANTDDKMVEQFALGY